MGYRDMSSAIRKLPCHFDWMGAVTLSDSDIMGGLDR